MVLHILMCMVLQLMWGRTSFCTGLISRKLCRFLFLFPTTFASYFLPFVLLLFPLSITFFVLMLGLDPWLLLLQSCWLLWLNPVCLVYIVDELALVFPVLLKEVRMLHWCKQGWCKGWLAPPQTFCKWGGEWW